MTTPVRQHVLIAGYLIDAFVTEDHNFDSEVTEYPVEVGGSITDNIRPKPIVITVEGIVSDTPIGQIADLRQLGDSTYMPSAECLAVLEALRVAREPVSVTTSVRTFPSMVMTALSIPRDAATGFALRFSATFQEVLFVTNDRTTVRVATPSNGKQVNLGQKASLKELNKDETVNWNHGTPNPGDPLKPGYATEKLVWANNVYGGNVFLRKRGGWVRVATLDPLSEAELTAFFADRNRDLNGKAKGHLSDPYDVRKLPKPYPPK